MIAMPLQLSHLAQAYFHQDYDLEFSSPDGAVSAFVESEDRGAVDELASELDLMLASGLSESEFARLWVRELGATYDPSAHGQSYRHWFGHVRDLLKR